MKNLKSLLVFIDGIFTDKKNSSLAEYRWSWVYAHGKFEEDFGYDIPLFNQDEPSEEGYYLATAENNKTVVINLVRDEDNNMKGRCSYIDDKDGMLYVNSPQFWR